jgi:hypothetical protein
VQVEEEGADERVARVRDERLVGGDDDLDVLEVDDDGAVAAQDGGGVREERVEHAEVPRGQPRHRHDLVLPELGRVRLPRRRHHQPLPARRRGLPPRSHRRVLPTFHDPPSRVGVGFALAAAEASSRSLLVRCGVEGGIPRADEGRADATPPGAPARRGGRAAGAWRLGLLASPAR